MEDQKRHADHERPRTSPAASSASCPTAACFRACARRSWPKGWPIDASPSSRPAFPEQRHGAPSPPARPDWQARSAVRATTGAGDGRGAAAGAAATGRSRHAGRRTRRAGPNRRATAPAGWSCIRRSILLPLPPSDPAAFRLRGIGAEMSTDGCCGGFVVRGLVLSIGISRRIALPSSACSIENRSAAKRLPDRRAQRLTARWFSPSRLR